MSKLFAEVQEPVTYPWKWERKRMTWPKFILFQMVHLIFAILTCTIKLLLQFGVTHWFYSLIFFFWKWFCLRKSGFSNLKLDVNATNTKQKRKQKMWAFHEVACFLSVIFLRWWGLLTVLTSKYRCWDNKVLN